MPESDPEVAKESPFSLPNIRMFLVFRVLYNARFYYPVYALVFLDLGLTTQQFLILNMIWGLGIVVLEVPSGALADSIGRRSLMILGAILMIIEMSIFTFAPSGNVSVLFWLLVINRILSGASEALVSGADEALAYDTLKEAGMERLWDGVLARLMQIQSLAFTAALLIGSALYDERMLNGFCNMLGIDWQFSREQTLRIPLFLTLISSAFVLIAALKTRESGNAGAVVKLPIFRQMLASTKLVFSAGVWILKTPFALAVICGGFLVDAFLRSFITFASQYYQVIQLPEASYGVIGAVMSGLGVIWPSIARKLGVRFGPLGNFLNIAGMTLIGLIGVSLFIPYFGLLWVLPMMAGWSFLNFFVSQYLNQVTASEQRATVLSFRGLSFNLAYSLATWALALLMSASEGRVLREHPDLSDRLLENAKLVDAIPVLPVAFAISIAIFVIFVFFRMSPSDVPDRAHSPQEES
ncbi:MAG: MFS transporter [Verrucomicrobiota bacterium]